MNLKKLILLAAAAAVLAWAGYFLFLQPDAAVDSNVLENTPASNMDSDSGDSGISPEQGTPAARYKDGTYTGTGEGKNGPVEVRVTIAGDCITDIAVLSSFDEDKYFSQAEAMIPGAILAAQSTSVDVCSGATISSEGIISAVADALAKALLK